VASAKAVLRIIAVDSTIFLVVNIAFSFLDPRYSPPSATAKQSGPVVT
jgi:hypothetical protein